MENKELLNAFFSELETNIADEAIARKGYYNSLTKFDCLLTSDERLQINEIISEELKHSILLSAMIENRNHIVAED